MFTSCCDTAVYFFFLCDDIFESFNRYDTSDIFCKNKQGYCCLFYVILSLIIIQEDRLDTDFYFM